MESEFPRSVLIREVGPREGFQTLDKIISTDNKLKLITALAQTGLKEIEVCSFVRPDLMPQMADAAGIAEGLPESDVTFSGLYLNVKGFELAAKSRKLTNRGWINIAASKTFLEKNANTTVEKLAAGVSDWVEAFKAEGLSLNALMVSTAFGCNYEGPIKVSSVLGVISQIVEAAARNNQVPDEICLADTMGWATPEQLKSIVLAVRKEFSDSEVTLHLHDTRGIGLANVYAGLQVGVKTFDSSVGGLGGCPFAKGASGNVATEELVYLCQSLGIETGINLNSLLEAAALAGDITGLELPSKLLKSGVWEAQK